MIKMRLLLAGVVDSEDDEHETTALDLPSRSQILRILRQRCADGCIQPDFNATVIHYLYGAVTLELLVDMRHLGDTAIAALEIQQAASQRIFNSTLHLAYALSSLHQMQAYISSALLRTALQDHHTTCLSIQYIFIRSFITWHAIFYTISIYIIH